MHIMCIKVHKKCHRRHNLKMCKNDESRTFWKSEILGPTILSKEQKNSRTSRVLRKYEFFNFLKNSRNLKFLGDYSIHIPLKTHISIYTSLSYICTSFFLYMYKRRNVYKKKIYKCILFYIYISLLLIYKKKYVCIYVYKREYICIYTYVHIYIQVYVIYTYFMHFICNTWKCNFNLFLQM